MVAPDGDGGHTSTFRKSNMVLNRGTGLLVIEVRHSNPNGDPDAESEPRTLEADGRGLISPVSFKRKLRELVEKQDSPVWQTAQRALRPPAVDDALQYGILESRGRKLDKIRTMDADTFARAYWDARVFGNTILEAIRNENKGAADRDHFVSTGVVQFGPGISVAPVEIERLTMTNKAGVEEGKDRGMAPLGWRVVRHGVYSMPFFVNPMMAGKTGCVPRDIELLQFLIPYAYSGSASAVRPFVELRHAWYAEHKTPLGSCRDSIILDALTPRKIDGGPEQPSVSINEYEIPDRLPAEVVERLARFEDLCTKSWE